jgi:hypothetical protein
MLLRNMDGEGADVPMALAGGYLCCAAECIPQFVHGLLKSI